MKISIKKVKAISKENVTISLKDIVRTEEIQGREPFDFDYNDVFDGVELKIEKSVKKVLKWLTLVI